MAKKVKDTDDLVLVDEFILKQLKLIGLDVNKFTETKNKMTYLSWSHAWEEFIKIFPKATYKVLKNTDGNAFFGTSKMGYMCFTEVTAMDITREMWLLVMNGANKTLKDDSYTYESNEYDWVWNEKYKKKTKQVVGTKENKVEAINMFDVNKTIMRCMVKNLAMFGLGMYIYKGDNLPSSTDDYIEPPLVEKAVEEKTSKASSKTSQKKSDVTTPLTSMEKQTDVPTPTEDDLKPISKAQIQQIHILLGEGHSNKDNIYGFFEIKSSKELNNYNANEMIKMLKNNKKQSEGKIIPLQINQLLTELKRVGATKKSLLTKFKVKMIDDLTYGQAKDTIVGLMELPTKESE